jgi:hypothetical protein
MKYYYGECFYNAVSNRINAEKMLGKKFKVVIGGLGLSEWFEYGSKNPEDKAYNSNPHDSHAWLESDDGFIIDFMFPEYQEVCDIRGIECNRETLKQKYGLDFVPASSKMQKSIFKTMEQGYEFKFKIGVLTRVDWKTE